MKIVLALKYRLGTDSDIHRDQQGMTPTASNFPDQRASFGNWTMEKVLQYQQRFVGSVDYKTPKRPTHINNDLHALLQTNTNYTQ